MSHRIFRFSFSRTLWLVLIAMVAYQLVFTWIPLWQRATELEGVDISDVRIVDEGGKLVYLSSFKGEILILNFWATWCLPCRVELPLLNGIYSDLLKKNKQLIGVNQNESWGVINRFRLKTEILFPVYRDQGALSKRLNIQLIPAIVVVDKKGKVKSISYGFRPWIQAYLLWWI